MKEPRQENTPHILYVNKTILRNFRNNLKRKEYKNFRNVYLALCEISSDFAENKNSNKAHVQNLTKTCATYAGTDINMASKTMQSLREMGLIDYGMIKDNKTKKFAGSYLMLLKK